MDNRKRKMFWSLHEQLMKIIDMKSYYLINRDNENYEEKAEELLITIDSIQKIILPKEELPIYLNSYFE